MINNLLRYGSCECVNVCCAQVLGPGRDRELFYTDGAVKQAFKNYISTLLLRKNTVNGQVYKDDPAIFAGNFPFMHYFWILLKYGLFFKREVTRFLVSFFFPLPFFFLPLRPLLLRHKCNLSRPVSSSFLIRMPPPPPLSSSSPSYLWRIRVPANFASFAG